MLSKYQEEPLFNVYKATFTFKDRIQLSITLNNVNVFHIISNGTGNLFSLEPFAFHKICYLIQIGF